MGSKDFRHFLSSHWKPTAIVSAAVIVAAAGIFAYASSGGRDLSDRELIVATVNGTPISVKRFNESYVNFLITSGQNDTEGNRYLHLNALIDSYVMAEEAERRGFDETEEFRKYRDRKLKHTVGGQYYYQVFLDTLAPLDETDIRESFKRSKEQIVVRHLLFRDPEDAAQAYERLEQGEDFVQLANEVFETAEYDSMAGFLGVASYFELDDAFAEAAWNLPVGVPSEPVRTRYGYHIILKEDHLYNPLLTESEFTYRQEGISQRAHMRKMRMEGDRFIREYMMSLDVQINEDAVIALHEAIQRLTVKPDEVTYRPPSNLTSVEIGQLSESFTPETPLLTYELDGERRTFTALDYYNWLEELPWREVRSRTAASIGRALRNEVLAIKGFEANLDEHEVVQEYMTFASNLFLAQALRKHLRENERATPTEEEITEAFDRLGYGGIKYSEADFWTISFDTFQEATEAKTRIEAGADPSSYDGYQYYENADLRPLKSLGGHVRRALLNTPTVLGDGDGDWYVYEVLDRTVEWITVEEKYDQIREQLATYMPEARLAGELRSDANVTIDSALFRELMERR